jgi:hypothetical protein
VRIAVVGFAIGDGCDPQHLEITIGYRVVVRRTGPSMRPVVAALRDRVNLIAMTS